MTERERIARIIDPEAWALWPDDMAAQPGDIHAGQKRVRAASLIKADLILAGQPDIGKVVEFVREVAKETAGCSTSSWAGRLNQNARALLSELTSGMGETGGEDA